MAKIPFSIKYRPQIENGEYKVETREGKPSRILCWDRRGERSLVVLVQQPLGYDDVLYYYESGLADGIGRELDEDLFIVTPEEELTEFEKAVDAIYESCNVKELRVKDKAAELLSLARKQFIKDGYVIEKKAFHDAVENISDKHRAEMSVEYSIHCKVEDGTRHAIMNWEAFQKVAQKFIEIGKAEALKDLPRWRRIMDNGKVDANGCRYTDSLCLIKQGWYRVLSKGTLVSGNAKYLSVADLEKLPGFKEDEGHE